MTYAETLLDDQQFLGFMAAAKRYTFAKGGTEKAENLPDGGKRYTFMDPQWFGLKYEDTWYGQGELENPFFGTEMFYEQREGSSIWTPVAYMGYTGEAYEGAAPPSIEEIFSFLIEMLQRVPDQYPFRGPEGKTPKDNLEYALTLNRESDFRVRGHETIGALLGTTWLGKPWYRNLYQLDFVFCCLR